jgi:hypothetical protein
MAERSPLFGLLKEKAAVTVEMHGYVFDVSVHMYSDVRGFAAGCVVIQMRNGIPYPVLYDAFTLVHAQKKYGTYKRELCGIVEFCRSHSHFFQAHETSIICADHKPLTWFIDSTNHEGIYARWVTELRLLNV